MSWIERACEASMPRIGRAARRKAAYWWTEEIGELRQRCNHYRRQYTRARRAGPAIRQAEEYRHAKKNLKRAIQNSRRRKWEELRADLNADPWGLGYKLVMRKLGKNAHLPDLMEERIHSIVSELFPSHELRRREDFVNLGHELPPMFSTDELTKATKSMKLRRAPGPDGVPTEVLSILARERPQLLLNMYNACLVNGIFPEIWKIQRLVLLRKGKGDPNLPSSYRPICLLDTAGKLLEGMLKPRLSRAIEEAGGLSRRQYGFRSGRSTIGALEEVMESVKAAHRSRNIVLLVTLDVKNAFNSARWCDILDALEVRFRVPYYLSRIVRSYLDNRKLIYDTRNGPRCIPVTAGAAQGSILGPELWNIMYDEILCMDMPVDTYLVGYADDIAGVITARDAIYAQRKLNQVMLRVQSWMQDHGLKLAVEKTELLILTRKHIPVEIPMRTQFDTFETRRSIEYLGIRLDSKLHFWSQIHNATKRAAQATASLSRLMANTGGPTAGKRKLLMDTVQAILLYGCEIWAEALRARHRLKALSSVQKTAALRVASAYRTVSEAAVMVISGTVPIDLLVMERREKWQLRNNLESRISAQEIRRRTIQTWQQRWQNERFGRWTARLIPMIDIWLERKFGEVNYYLTQFLSGHGYFRKYLHRMGKVNGQSCIYGDSREDDAEHTFFQCGKWQELRMGVEHHLGTLTVENVVRKMLLNEENWNIIARFVEQILREKKKDLDRDQLLGNSADVLVT